MRYTFESYETHGKCYPKFLSRSWFLYLLHVMFKNASYAWKKENRGGAVWGAL